MPVNAQEFVRKWSANLRGSRKAIEAGVQGVQVSPTEKAAQKVDKYVAGVQKAAETGKYQAGLRAVTLESWKQSMLTKGIQRLDSGVTAAEGKVANFAAQFLPFVETVSQQIQAMPDTTESDRDQRMLENVRRLRQFKYQRSGR